MMGKPTNPLDKNGECPGVMTEQSLLLEPVLQASRVLIMYQSTWIAIKTRAILCPYLAAHLENKTL